MKKFLIKCVLFFCVIFAVFVLTTAIDLALRTKISFELPRDKTVLFIGDSHVVASVNEKFIPGAFNNAKPADFYLNMFPRMRKLIEANPQIHTVFVAATPYTLSDDADLRIFTKDAEELIQLNIPFYDQEERMDSRKAAITNKSFRSFERAFGRIFNGRASELEALGGFKGLEDGYLSKEIENNCKLVKGRLGPIKSDHSNSNNELTLKYLRKIVEFVHYRGGVRIIFLNPPLYHAGEFFDVPHFESVLKEKFPDVEFWDYADFPIPDDGFYNVNHLNDRGAEIFSKELARRMQSERIIAPEKAPNS